MFGPARSPATSLVLAQLRERFGLESRSRVHGQLNVTGWKDSVELAHLIDGYGVIEQLCVPDVNDWLETHAGWPSASTAEHDLGEAWTTLFLEHRCWRTASPYEPQGDERQRLDRLVRDVRRLVESELEAASEL